LKLSKGATLFSRLLLIIGMVWAGVVYDFFRSGTAWAYFEKHPVHAATVFPVRHPVKTGKGVWHIFRHPTKTCQKVGEKTLALGKWYETSGASGAGALLRDALQIGITAGVYAGK